MSFTPSGRGNPCPVCGRTKDGDCRTTGDGAVFCHTHTGDGGVFGWDYCGQAKDGMWGIWRAEGDDRRGGGATRPRTLPPASPRQTPTPRPPAGPTTDWAGAHEAMFGRGDGTRVESLARDLGVTTESLLALGCCWVPKAEAALYARYNLAGLDGWRSCWVFPMRGGDGGVTSLSRRFADGRKMTAPKREADPPCNGLYYPDDLLDRPGPILVVEGPSDAAALWQCGLAAVGRPSNTGGAHHLARLLRECKGREVIVVGENDKKESGLWPGRDGAEKVARELAAAAGLTDVKWGLCPGGAKDARAWCAGREGAWAGEEFLAAMRAEGLVCLRPAVSDLSASSRPLNSDRPARPAPTPTVWGLLDPEAGAQPAPARCPGRVTEVLAHRTRHGRYRVANLPCGAWGCPSCRQRKAARLCSHLAGCAQHALDTGRPLRAVELAAEERDGVRKALSRAGQLSYAELQRPDGSYLFLFALATAVLPGRVRHAEPLTPAEAARLLSGWCLEVKEKGLPAPNNESGRVRPVNTSADWRMPKTPPSGAWKVVHGSPAQQESTVEEVLVKCGVVVLPPPDWPDTGLERPPYVWSLEFDCPDGDRERVLYALATALDTPERPPFDDLPP